MNNILRIDSSIFGLDGQSYRLTEKCINEIKNMFPNTNIVERQLGDDSFPHYSKTNISEGTAYNLGTTLIEEVEAADILVIAAPMYNFGIPSQLKSWFDHILRAGRTFKYGEHGPEGLLSNKKVFVITTRGGSYKNTNKDSLTIHIQTLFEFIGLREGLTIFYAENLALDREKEKQMMNVEQELKQCILTQSMH